MSRIPRFARSILLVAILSGASATSSHSVSATSQDSARPPSAARYIIQLADPPLATWQAARPSAEAPSAEGDGAGRDSDSAASVAPRARLDIASPDAAAYLDRLEASHDAFAATLQRVAPAAAPSYRYRIAFNGVTARLTPAEAERVAALPGVVAVTREERIVPLMDASLPRIGAPAAWADPAVGGRADAGRGVRIAVIDSGITAAHPFFDDAGFVAPAGFPTSTLTVGDRVLPYAPDDVARFTNRKVIVARAYANPETVTAEGDPRAAITPLADGLAGFHGAHVAGTAAGAVTRGAPGNPGTGTLDLSGVAPGAYLMAYKFTNAYTPEILRMIDDAVLDGADVINNSWGTSAMNVLAAPHHPVGQAFQGAIDAGVVVVSAAGNAGGNGEATLGGPHQMLDGAITVANSETGRSFAYHLTASHAELPAELERHPTAYQAFGNPFGVIERQAARTDLCNPIALALQARSRIFVAPLEGACETSVIPLPLPAELAWVEKLLVAGIAQAQAVVLYSPDADVATTAQLLAVLELLKPLLEQIVGQVLQIDELVFPVTAVISGPEAMALAEYADAHPDLRLRMDATPTTVLDPARADAAAPSSAQGPAVAGAPSPAGGSVKPDLAAPGTDVLSTNTTVAGEPAGFTTATGTSMASPHVAGAAAVLRQAWPGWSPADVKAALVITADSVVSDTVAAARAPATVQGAGRLDLARAIDPGALLHPPSRAWTLAADGVASEAGVVVRVADARRMPEGAAPARWTVAHEPATGGGVPLPGLPEALDVPAGGEAELDLSFDTAGLAPGDYDGRVALSDGTRTVRFTYAIRQLPPARDVLLVDVRRTRQAGGGGLPGFPGLPGGATFSDGPDHARYWTDALADAGLEADVWTVAEGQRAGAPPLSVLQGYRLVIVAAGDGNAPLDALPGGMTSLQMYLLGGGRMLLSGPGWAHDLGTVGDLQNSGSMVFLSRYFAGFEHLADDDAPAALRSAWRPGDPGPAALDLACPASDEAAGNGGRVDLGRPLAAIRTAAEGNVAPVDLGIAAPLAAERIIGRARALVVDETGRSAVTGVTGNATLEHPQEEPGIPWRAAFAGFAVEAVCGSSGTLPRAELLRAAWSWATESGGATVTVDVPAEAVVGAPVTLRATATTPEGVEVVGWRWDLGDGRPYASTTAPVLEGVRYAQGGPRTVRAEAMTASALTYVGEAVLGVRGATLYVPSAAR